MQKLIWTNANGDSVDLTSGNYGITNWEGFSNTSLNIQSQQVPFQDGGVFLDALIEQRELTVTLAIQDNGNLEERYRMRRELIHLLNPKLGEGYLIYTNDFTSKRIKCVAQIPLFENHNSNDSGTPKASLAWTACEPYWEDLEETVVVIEKGERQSIINEGDIICGININLQTGYIQEPFIKNLTQSKIIKLNGDFNQDIKIDTNVGHKSITQEQLNFHLQSMGMSLNQIAYSPLLNITIIANQLGNEQKPDEFGKNGLISYDGVNWELFSKNIKSIYWCKETSIFIACECIEEYRYQIIISEDGVNWTNSGDEITYPIFQFIYNPITEMYIGNGASYYSEDLITWNSISGFAGQSNSLLIQPDGTLLIAEHNGIYRGSIESVTKVLNINLGDNAQICYSTELSKYVACGYNVNKLYTSIDGINWVEGVTIGSNFTSLKYENGNFILNANNITKKSADAEVWVDINNTEQIFDCLYIHEYGIYLFAGYGCLYSSNNLQNWEAIFDNQSYNVVALKYNPIFNIYIIILSSNNNERTLFVSSNLKSWNFIINLGLCDKNDIVINSENGGFIVTGNSYYYSPDGINFNILGVSSSFNGVDKGIYSPELHKFIFVSSDNYVAGEPSNSKIIIIDGNNINQITEINIKTAYNVDTFLKDIIYNTEQNLYVVIGEHNGYIGKSSNGTTWTFTPTIESGSSDGFQVSLLLYSNRLNKYIGVKDKKIGQSVDGVTWSVNVFAFSENIKDIIETDKYGLVVVGENGYMASSYNSNEWIIIPTSTKMNIYTISYSQDFLLGLNFGVIINSQQISNKNIISSLSSISDMTLGLNVGNNEILFNAGAGHANCTISYRQKYIGV